MEKDKKEWEKKAKCVYVPPKVEVHAAAPGRLLGTSFYTSDHNSGESQDDDNDHNSGHNEGIEYGAKAVILGQEFSFSDLWEEWAGQRPECRVKSVEFILKLINSKTHKLFKN